MSLIQQLDEDLKAAMRSGDTLKRDTVRLLRGALKNAEIENREPLDDEAAVRVLAKEAKQRRDSIEEYKKGNRQDLVDREQAELDIIASYLPEAMSVEDLQQIVRESITAVGAQGPSDMGKVMKEALGRVKGRADGSAVNAVVREMLSGLAG